MPRPTFDDLRSSYKPTLVCACGAPAPLLCDGRIYKHPRGHDVRVPRNFINGETRSCDAPICRQCTKKVAAVHIRMKGGCRFDTVDLCKACQEANPSE